ncbi:MAG TPA: gliding motility-associated C-terminal domain-containing protein, partial [Saprospiraceae bacterium]|nr:gliding motility-associated C-terminal domain-containing protein [Saprospiraceae bacterium]
GTWQASGPTVLDVSNPNSVSIPPNAAPGNYAFRYTINSVACGPSISLPNLSLSKAPDAGVGAITNACQSGLGSINLFNYLTGNANNAGTWSSPEYSISTPTTFNANQMAAGTHKFYYHTSANAGNGLVCKDSADVVFNIAAASNAGQDATTTVCKGQQVNLVALLTGATSTGVFKDPASSGGLSGSTFNSSAVNAGTFSILHILPAQNGCLADTSKINVTVEAKPNAGADLSVSRCDLNAVDLKPLVAANPNGNFSLAAGAGSLNNGVLTPSGPGQFKVLYIAGDGQPCPKDTAVIDLNMAVRPPAALQSIPSFCQGDEVLVNFTGQPGILYSLIVQNQTQFNSGNVNNNLFGSIFLLLTSQQTIKLNPALFEPGITYHVSIVEIETTDCDFTLSPGVIQTTFVISPATLTNQNGSICRGETVTIGTVIFDENHTKDTIRYSSATGCDSLVSYNFALLDSSVYNYVFSTCDQNYTYTVNGKSFNKATPVGRVKLNVPNSQGCDSIVSVALSFTVPTAQFQTQNAPCEDATGSVNILQSSLVPASLYLNGVLTEQLTSLPKLLVLEPGVYNLEIRDANGCTTTQSISIGTDPSPDFSVVEAQNNGQSILSIQPAFDFTSIQWQPAGQVVSPQAAITAVTGYGLFTADLEYSPGCFTQVSYLIEKTVVKDIYWPNTLDPDLPGNNLFFPVKSDDYIVDLTSIEIYDRWGNRLFLRENAVWGQADQGWDGTFNGKNVTPGVYVFVLNLKETDGKTRSIVGDITITR